MTTEQAQNTLDAIGRSVLPELHEAQRRDAGTIAHLRGELAARGFVTTGEPDAWGEAWLQRMRLLEDIADAAYVFVTNGAQADELRVLLNELKGRR